MNYRPWNIYGVLILILVTRFSFSEGTLYLLQGDKTDAARVNYVFLAEGYTKDQEEKFLDDVSNIVDSLFARSPYREYPDFLNVWGIFVASADSGVDKPLQDIERDTYFDGSFSNSTDRIVSIHNKTAAYELLAEHVPDYDLPAVIINDSKYGGSGSEFATFTASTYADFLFIHEAAHTFANLVDEYESSGTSSAPGISLARRKVTSATKRDSIYWRLEQRNYSTTTNRDSIPWKYWILPETPIPTPETSEYADVIGLFEGAAVPSKGYYRPKLDCIMRSTNAKSFCSVCIETHIFKFYLKVSPVKNKSPQDSTIDYHGGPMLLSVEARTTVPNTIRTLWTLDDTIIHQGNEIDLDGLALEDKAYTIKAIVSDSTPLVLNPEVLEIMSDTVNWNLNVAITDVGRYKTIPPDEAIAIHVKNRCVVLLGLRNIARPFTVSLYSINGRLVYSRDIFSAPHDTGVLRVPIPPFLRGMYVIRIHGFHASMQRVFKGIVVN